MQLLSRIAIMIQLVVFLFVLVLVDSFQLHVQQSFSRSLQKQLFRFHRLSVSTCDDKYGVLNDVMGGVESFDEWWRSFNKNNDANVQHASFINNCQLLRGLQYIGSTPFGDGEQRKAIQLLKIPRSKVLSTSFSDDKSRDDWDSNLAWSLLDECRKGASSSIHGYCSLLTKGQTQLFLSSATDQGSAPLVPEYTAPDALRHWTTEQKQHLLKTVRGRHLVELEEKQRLLWEKKYYNSDASRRAKASLPQFLWAMEVVHSRAFCGDFGGPSSSNLILSIVVPLVATVIGYKALMDSYTTYTNDSNELIAMVCAAVAALVPIYYSQKSNKVAVLLPFIDSANHLQDADSSIEYDVLQDCIVLNAGPKCFVKSNTTTFTDSTPAAVTTTATQLFINYGKNKKDEELLLNYGFINNNNNDDGKSLQSRLKMWEDSTANRDFIRKNLAEAFTERNS